MPRCCNVHVSWGFFHLRFKSFAQVPKIAMFLASAIDSSKKFPFHLWTLSAYWRGCALDQPARKWKQFLLTFAGTVFWERKNLGIFPLLSSEEYVCRQCVGCLLKPSYIFKLAPWSFKPWEDSLKSHLSMVGCLTSWAFGIQRWIKQGLEELNSHQSETYVTWQRL